MDWMGLGRAWLFFFSRMDSLKGLILKTFLSSTIVSSSYIQQFNITPFFAILHLFKQAWQKVNKMAPKTPKTSLFKLAYIEDKWRRKTHRMPSWITGCDRARP